MASRQERADVAQAAGALRLLLALPAAALAMAWEALPQLQRAFVGDSCIQDAASAAVHPDRPPLQFGAPSRV